MRTLLARHGKWIAMNCVFWCLAKQLFFAIKLWGFEDTVIQSVNLPAGPMFGAIILTGLIDGIIFSMVDIVIDRKFTSLKFYQRVISKSILNMGIGLGISLVMIPFFLKTFSGYDVHLLDRSVGSGQVIVLGVYFLLLTLIVQFLKLTLAWMKTQDIFDIIAHPYGIEEERIFLFLDMKSSTSLAERMQTTTYSRMVQECFHDLSAAAKSTQAEIYQYVGDEAVLTWRENPENFLNAIKFFHIFQYTLRSKSDIYKEQFDAVPEFKAGIHHGRVIKAQVGMMRKEIAFHGDAINTASRIQSKCSELQRDLLVSESFRNNIPGEYQCTWEGAFQIRGKSGVCNIYSVALPEGEIIVEKQIAEGLIRRIAHIERMVTEPVRKLFLL